MKEILVSIFEELHSHIEAENKERRNSGVLLLEGSKITILGQTSLLVQPEFTWSLSLAQTGDLYAFLSVENFVKQKLKEILPHFGFIYDEDSPLIFIPRGSRFLPFLDLPLLEVLVIDPESALVSKGVKAPKKNTQLIRQAIASGDFPNLVDRIISEGGDLNLIS